MNTKKENTIAINQCSHFILLSRLGLRLYIGLGQGLDLGWVIVTRAILSLARARAILTWARAWTWSLVTRAILSLARARAVLGWARA